ncbi:MAG: heavy metal transport/detoxification protein [Clostridiales bacterium 38-18]|nr:MAG: heavy metal transport/detoxification protein [Clostridiales bacterium 38-18]
MEKKLVIEGMSCNHCKMRVENALKGVEGVTNAVVDLAEKSALVTLNTEVDAALLKETVEDAGYDVVSVQ